MLRSFGARNTRVVGTGPLQGCTEVHSSQEGMLAFDWDCYGASDSWEEMETADHFLAVSSDLVPPQSCQLESRRASSDFIICSIWMRESIEAMLVEILSFITEQLHMPARRTSRMRANSLIGTSIDRKARMISNSARLSRLNRRYLPSDRAVCSKP